MKHYSLLLWLTLAICIASCNKNDCIPHQELWQISVVERTTRLQYKYDDHRALTHITQLPWSFGPNFLLTSDQLKRPLTMRDSISSVFDKFIYQGGKLIRVDTHSDNATVTAQTFFTYDAQGRIIKKEGNANYYDYVEYEYEGNSRNFNRASFYSYPTGARVTQEQDASLIMEYTYDNKTNPFTTLLNTRVIPFWNSEYMGPTFYDPIVPNNVTKLKFYGKVDTGYFKFMEHNFTYVYEHNFPVTHTFRYTSYNTDGTPGFESTQPGSHTYDKFSW